VTAYKVHHPVKTNLPTPPTQATPPATHDRPSTLAEKEELQAVQGKGEHGTKRSRDKPRPYKLGFAIRCEQRAMKMTTEIDLVSRAEFLQSEMELRQVHTVQSRKGRAISQFMSQNMTPGQFETKNQLIPSNPQETDGAQAILH